MSALASLPLEMGTALPVRTAPEAPTRPAQAAPRHLRLVTDEEAERYARERAARARATRPVAVRRSDPIVLTPRGRLSARIALAVLAVGAAIALGALLGLLFRTVPVAGVSVTVGQGETLWSIAQAASPGADVRDTVADIVALNGLADSTLRPGQILVLPATE